MNEIDPLIGTDCEHGKHIAEDVIFMVNALVIDHHTDTKEERRGDYDDGGK